MCRFLLFTYAIFFCQPQCNVCYTCMFVFGSLNCSNERKTHKISSVRVWCRVVKQQKCMHFRSLSTSCIRSHTFYVEPHRETHETIQSVGMCCKASHMHMHGHVVTRCVEMMLAELCESQISLQMKKKFQRSMFELLPKLYPYVYVLITSDCVNIFNVSVELLAFECWQCCPNKWARDFKLWIISSVIPFIVTAVRPNFCRFTSRIERVYF